MKRIFLVKRAQIILAIFIVVVSMGNACAQLPAGDRIMSFQVDMSENNNYDSAFSYALRACMQSAHQAYSWTELEPVPGNISGPLLELLPFVNIYFPAYGIKAELNIPVTNSVKREVPDDLELLPFSDSLMIARFKTLLDSVFSKLPDLKLTVLTIGNESDIMWGADSTKYQDFKIFLDSVSVYAKDIYFGLHGEELQVATKLTYEGLTDPVTSGWCQQLNADVDVIAVTYYGIGPTMMVIDPGDVVSEFGKLVALYPDTAKPIYFLECGYPSSAANGSSFEMQRQFIEEVFVAWDSFAPNIKLISFFKISDWSQEIVDLLAVYYGLPTNTVFKEFLRTLGLRTWPGDGSNKPAYEQLKCELSARNWCATSCKLVGIEDELEDESGFGFSPNPSSQSISVFRDQDGVEPYSVSVFNLSGQLLYFKEGITSAAHQVDIGFLNGGIYFLRLETAGEMRTLKLIVE